MPDTDENPSPEVYNHILLSLPRADAERLLSRMRRVKLPPRRVLCRNEEPVSHVYFLNSGVASNIMTTETGEMAEVGLIGYEGVVGVEAALGLGSAASQLVMMQVGGDGLVVKTSALSEELGRCAPLRDSLLRFARFFLHQVSQTLACKTVHPLDESLARWLLTMSDRARADHFHLTHEFIAEMLGVRRAGVTVVTGKLKELGLISYSRGDVRILDRPGLEAAACECYGVLKREFDRLFEGERRVCFRAASAG